MLFKLGFFLKYCGLVRIEILMSNCHCCQIVVIPVLYRNRYGG